MPYNTYIAANDRVSCDKFINNLEQVASREGMVAKCAGPVGRAALVRLTKVWEAGIWPGAPCNVRNHPVLS